MIACVECGLVVRLPPLGDGGKAQCPRCSHTLTKIASAPYQTALAVSTGALIALVFSLSLPFMSFSVQGLSQQITLLQAAEMMSEYENILLGLLLFSTVIVLPTLYIGMIFYLHLKALQSRKRKLGTAESRLAIALCRLVFRIEPWLMVDVFLIGVLVSLIKIASLADVGMGHAFWAFCLFTVLVVKCVALADRHWLWQHFVPSTVPHGIKVGDTHDTGNHASCQLCHHVNPLAGNAPAKCRRCGSALHPFNPTINLQHAWALLIAAIIFYLPANFYPMMFTVSLGQQEGSTIMEGVILLWELGSYPIALVIFIASVFIPIAKMLALGWLYLQAQSARRLPPQQTLWRLRIYRITEFIGRWSMIDIFVVAILVALVQLQNLMAIYPGPAALYFAAVVILTMLSAKVFDSRTLWPTAPIPYPAEHPIHG
ncbi:paraquat-inducible protein A [Motiliproteus sediminis]|uniref:paraquat-inducible protein A n=1 Tax=Motiliproteus sediminis TaxID=1468178 RepID=UPI0031BAC372